MQPRPPPLSPTALRRRIEALAYAQGFGLVGFSHAALGEDVAHLEHWLREGRHGQMQWMERNHDKRRDPAALVPGTLTVVSVGLDYAQDEAQAWNTLADGERAYVARYALGRDYHKLMRKRLQALASGLEALVGPMGHRVFVDSAPVLERALARNAGLGWIGKHTCVINARRGSWFFLGELFIDIALPVDAPASFHCGSCTRCIDICPTQAIVAPNELDARRCISYLTIEHPGSIDPALRPLIGNRIFGCDDCQLICPWNKFARRSDDAAFRARNRLDEATLVELFAWTETEFLSRTEGSAIRRSGWQRWRRNIAVALGNAPASAEVLAALAAAAEDADDIVREHVHWALQRRMR